MRTTLLTIDCDDCGREADYHLCCATPGEAYEKYRYEILHDTLFCPSLLGYGSRSTDTKFTYEKKQEDFELLYASGTSKAPK